MSKPRILFVESDIVQKKESENNIFYRDAFDAHACLLQEFRLAFVLEHSKKPFDAIVTELRPQDVFYNNIALLINKIGHQSPTTRIVILSGANDEIIEYALDELKENTPEIMAIGISKHCSPKDVINTLNLFIQGKPHQILAKNNSDVILPSSDPFKECPLGSHHDAKGVFRRYSTRRSLKQSLQGYGYGSGK